MAQVPGTTLNRLKQVVRARFAAACETHRVFFSAARRAPLRPRIRGRNGARRARRFENAPAPPSVHYMQTSAVCLPRLGLKNLSAESFFEIKTWELFKVLSEFFQADLILKRLSGFAGGPPKGRWNEAKIAPGNHNESL